MSDIQLTGFEMQHKLGQGGMASVWKAKQISLDRTVAIKILSSHFASDPTDIQRFQQEAQSAAKLKHPGIVQVYDANIENGLYFFVMEFVDGYTCADWLKRKGTLSEQDVLLIADCVADALGYAWDKENMIHCDIKPDNIMIDEDGTVKVTDLGLSRTISGMNVDEDSDEILGTPAYMAPEQAMGEPNQDCRLDMYALGAMMYHLSTGQLLFEGSDESEVMERQITDTVENPRDLNPALSRGFCKLVRALMAKEKEHRPPDWQHVREGIARVKKGLGPRLKLPKEAVSTVRESVNAADEPVRPHVTAGQIGSMVHSPKKKSGVLGVVVGVAVLAVVLAVAAKLLMGPQRPPRPQPGTSGSGTQGAGPGSQSAEARGRTMYYSASNWEKANRGSYDEAIRRYQEIVSNCGGTKYAERASKDIERLQSAKEADAQAAVLASLDAEARPLIAQHQYDRAVGVYESYSGVCADETRAARNSKVAELKQKKAAWERDEAERKAAELAAKLNQVMSEAVALIVKGDYTRASGHLEDVIIKGELPDRNDELHQVRGLLEAAANIDNKILASFERQKDQTVGVQLVSGSKNLKIQGVKSGVVLASEEFRVGGALASRSHNFRLTDLSVAERLSRMGNDGEQDVALVKGVLAYQSRAFAHARRYFEMTHSMLKPNLLALLDGSSKEVESAARDELAAILETIGIEAGGSFDSAAVAARVAAAGVGEEQVAGARAKAAAYAARYSTASFYSGLKPVVDAIQSLTASAAPDGGEIRRPPVPDVVLQPEQVAAAGDVDAFVDGLLRTNPQLDSEDIRCSKDDDGVITSVRIASAALRDIGPLSALKGLRNLEVRIRGDRQAELVDLAPLKGLPLVSLVLGPTRVGSLEPLEGMPLRELSIRGSLVRDLKPIMECPLESLDVSYTKVFDFSPLGRMQLERLDLSGTQVRSLAFIRNMRLKELELNDTGVFDFSPLGRTPLEVLRASGTQLRSLTVLRDCPLRILEANRSSVSDITPLEACALTLRELHLNETQVRSFSSLRRLNLTHLSVGRTGFSDLALIKHMNLSHLDVAGTRLPALDGLRSSEMRYLNIADTDISSIAFLDGAPILELVCIGSKVRNFRPIYGSGLERLVLDDPGSKWSLYSELPKLERVNGQYIHNDPAF